MPHKGSCPRLAGSALVAALVAACGAAEAGQPPLHTGPDGRSSIDLVWFDPLNAVTCPPAEIGREIADVFGELGVETTWTEGSDDEPTAPPQLNVVFLAAVPSSGLPADTLGVVLSRRNTRTVWIVVPNVLQAIRSGGPMSGSVTAAQLARGLGRVVAHEVVHLAAPRLGHTEDGLMRARLDRTALTVGTLRLDAASRRAVLPGLARLGDPASRLETLTIVG